VQAFSTPSDLWVNARHLLDSHANERMYVWVYWGELDHLVLTRSRDGVARLYLNGELACERQMAGDITLTITRAGDSRTVTLRLRPII
jgi:hypothetical protein